MKLVVGVLTAGLVFAAAGCGYAASATFNTDGSVTIGLKLLFPKDLMQGTNGASISGFTPTELSQATAELDKNYPGAKITSVTEGDESGALITIPFKTEKAAFDFLTAPSQLNPSGATSGTGVSLNLGNTGGLFTAASHTSSGGVDTYSFTTAAQPVASPSPGSQQVISDTEIASIFTITFSLTVPHEITSAPGAVFTLDRKTAIWKLNWTKSETLTATTGPDTGLVAAVTPASDFRVTAVIGVVAIVLGLLIGMFMPWRRMRPVPAPIPVAPTPTEETPPPDN
ncbi:MAG TPA: hypothetical protein VFK22_04040 [Candidatus Dormibacteraeota bacterium]|nr:hypothetical protein [Candidatus Dormibacteraeota bacterium]